MALFWNMLNLRNFGVRDGKMGRRIFLRKIWGGAKTFLGQFIPSPEKEHGKFWPVPKLMENWEEGEENCRRVEMKENEFFLLCLMSVVFTPDINVHINIPSNKQTKTITSRKIWRLHPNHIIFQPKSIYLRATEKELLRLESTAPQI